LNKLSRIVCIDYGRKKLGIAMSDPLGITAQPFDTWHNLSRKQILDKIKDLIDDYGVDRIVVGLPLTLKGEKGKIADLAIEFVSFLRDNLHIKVVMWDERMSSRIAVRTLQTLGKKPSKDRNKIDKIAASVILQDYMTFIGNSAGN